ncbi:hypothetical protein CCH79_00014342 [Gambusia affinis]|uniref:AAA+ ATPase domain-containing protein n=1 Tax=Gambusia affinis TaxID=33528 RepID=A0A315UT50_GAMAF|nr:hypothetical protein CCH79_00014342 [Gambusia affinis]
MGQSQRHRATFHNVLVRIAILREDVEEGDLHCPLESIRITLETTFDTTVTTEVNGRSLPALAARSSPMAWRLGQSQTPRLQAGEAPSMPSGYSAPRSSTAGAAPNTGRYSGHSDPTRYLTDSGLHLYGRTAGRSSDVASPREIPQRGSKEMQGDIDSYEAQPEAAAVQKTIQTEIKIPDASPRAAGTSDCQRLSCHFSLTYTGAQGEIYIRSNCSPDFTPQPGFTSAGQDLPSTTIFRLLSKSLLFPKAPGWKGNEYRISRGCWGIGGSHVEMPATVLLSIPNKRELVFVHIFQVMEVLESRVTSLSMATELPWRVPQIFLEIRGTQISRNRESGHLDQLGPAPLTSCCLSLLGNGHVSSFLLQVKPAADNMSDRLSKDFLGPSWSGGEGGRGWDDSSSVSSGLSDTLDNFSTDDLNTPAYSATSSSRKSKGAQSQKGSRSKHAEPEVSSSWIGAEDLKKVEEELDASMDPNGSPSRWKPSPSACSPQTQGQYEDTGQKAAGLPQMSQTGSWRRGMTAQVGITPPRTKGASASLKSPGKTDDAKASEKGKVPSKSSAGIQRSPSDAGRSSGDEGKKPPSGIARPPATSSFGYKKIPGPAGTLITSSGAALTSGSATLGKAPKSSAALGKGTSIGGVRKTSLDGSQPQDDGILLSCSGSKVTLQYRSLPRPAKSSSGAAAAVAGRCGHRSSSSSIESNVSGKSAVGAATQAGAKRREGKVGSDRSSPITVNQTDKEKVGVSDQDPAAGLSTSPKSSPTSSSAGQSGLRQPGSKYPDIASPTFRRLFGTKASSKASSPGTPDSGKCPSILGSPHGTLARQASLDSPSSGTGSLGSAGGLSGGSSPLYGKTPDLCTDSLASSPASGLSLPSNARPWPACSSSAGSKDTLSCQSMTSLHTSSESIDMPLGHHGPKVTRTGSIKSTLSEGMPLDRNTLPKKGLRYPPSSRQTSHEEGKEWLRSHSTGGLQDTGSQSPLSPPGAACINTGKYHYSNLLSPTNINQYNLPPGSSGSMSRSNSIPAQDSFDLYGEGHPLGGSATSLEDRPRAISRSGSFRDSTDEVHGSSLSLVSSTSSLYSATEEKAHSEQIRKLRRELDASQEKVATLTSQLSANAHLVAAFEKSLSNMTCRLQSLTMTAEQKESELAELRETIEMLKTQNTDAQTAIQVALNGPDHLHKDLRIRRQHSSESMSSINSAASHASMGSLGKDAEDKKKKKKSWVADSIPAQLRSSFKQAFSKKKSKSQSAHDEMEEMTDSVPSSPKLQHDNRQGSIATLRSSPSTTELCECTEAEAEIILQLKNELREKELKLTDIRLEALSSAHHLDQIREAMNRMQNEIETLKAENDRLKSSGNATPTATPVKTARPPSEASSTSSSSSRQSLGLSLNNLNITDTIMSDILLDDSYEGNLRKESRSVRIVVTISSGPKRTKVPQSHEFLIGSIGVSGKTKWDVLDGVIRRLFKEYVFRVDPGTSLGLSSDSIVGYRMGEVIRCHASEVPELLPCGYLVGDNNIIKVHLKGMLTKESLPGFSVGFLLALSFLVVKLRLLSCGPLTFPSVLIVGVKENSIDSLVFDTLIPKPIIQRYLNLLMEHRRIILSGPSGTGKSFLAAKLAEYIISQMGQEVTEHNVASFNVDQNSSKDLRQYLSSLAERCNSERTDAELPHVVILDNLHHIGSLSDIFNGFLNCKYHKCPYVIGTMSQGVSFSPNLELHHNFRSDAMLCSIQAQQTQPTLSPDLSSSMGVKYQYLLHIFCSRPQLYGKRAVWEDPSKWVNDTYPWNAALLQQEGQSLLQLRPEDVGYDGYSSSKEGASSKQVSQSDTEGDPLVRTDLASYGSVY